MLVQRIGNSLSAINRKNAKRKPSALSKIIFSIDRHLLHFESEAHNAMGENKLSNDELWDRMSVFHETQIHRNWALIGRNLNLESPKTLGEKIEWLKLNYHKPLLIKLTDKLAVREYVIEKVGHSKILTQIIGVYNTTSEIPFEALPNKYVIKTNHWSGDLALRNDSQSICEREFSRKCSRIDRNLLRQYGTRKAEWPYWHIKPRVYVEEHLENQFAQLINYKFFCFYGLPKLIRVGKDKYSGEQQVSYFDTNWNLLPFRDAKAPSLEEGQYFRCPKSFDLMMRYASSLSESLPLARVDFYDIFGECKFGEITLYHESGLNCEFIPNHWNYRIGEWLDLPEICHDPELAYGKEHS